MAKGTRSGHRGGLLKMGLGLALLLVGSGCAHRAASNDMALSAEDLMTDECVITADWAASVEAPGLPNLHRVDEGVYRGAQPSREGIETLRQLGIRTVINLRLSEDHQPDLVRCGLDYEHIPSVPIGMEDESVVRFLELVSDPERQPVFIHCRRGADRTGLMTAVYRVVVRGWSKESALHEMRKGGYGYDPIFAAAMAEYVREMDVTKLRRSLGR